MYQLIFYKKSYILYLLKIYDIYINYNNKNKFILDDISKLNHENNIERFYELSDKIILSFKNSIYFLDEESKTKVRFESNIIHRTIVKDTFYEKYPIT